MQRHEVEAQAAQVALRSAVDEDADQIFGDPDRLEQVIDNLVVNALRFTPSGGCIRLQAHVDGHFVVLTVSDSGSGIAAKHLPHVFERFYKVDAARTNGSGGSFNIRIGTSASDRLAWFVDFFVAGSPRQGDTSENEINQQATLTGGAQVFVLEALWLRAGLGLGQLSLPSEADTATRTGLGAITGGGIDFLRRGRFALSGDLTFVSGVYKDGFVTAVVGQLGLTWY